MNGQGILLEGATVVEDEGLQPEADPEHGELLRDAGEQLHQHPGVLGPPGAWRDDETLRLQGEELRDARGVAPHDADLWTLARHLLVQVEGEGVAVVEEEDHGVRG